MQVQSISQSVNQAAVLNNKQSFPCHLNTCRFISLPVPAKPLLAAVIFMYSIVENNAQEASHANGDRVET